MIKVQVAIVKVQVVMVRVFLYTVNTMIHNSMFCQTHCPCQLSQLLFFCFPSIPPLLSLSPPSVLISCCQPEQFPLCGFPSHCIWFYLAVLGRPVLLLKGLAPSWNIHPSGALAVGVNAQSVSAHCWWHFAVALALGRQICHKGRGSVCPQTLRVLQSRAPAK